MATAKINADAPSAELRVATMISNLGLPGVDSLLTYPKFLQVETVGICNARCIMCPVEEWKRDDDIMRQELFEKIVDDIKDHTDWIERVTIQLDGEPLMDRQLEERIKLFKDAGVKLVAFATNGSLMIERRSRSIIESGVDEVSFSMDGATKETFEKIRLRLNYDKIIKNILAFIRIRDEMGAATKIRIRMTIQEENRHELDQFNEFWHEKLGEQDAVYAKVLHTWGNSSPGHVSELAFGYDFETLNGLPCSSPWTSLVILTDGRVPLCCCDFNARIDSGNVQDHTITELWQGRTLNGIRKLHGEEGRKSMPMCINCTVWDDGAKSEQD